MKILSIRQPWAYLITRGSKDIENRSWPTKYRGQFLVHASLRVDKKACLDHGLDPSKLQTGGVVGIAEIADCVQNHQSKWFVGPYGFVLKNRHSLPFVKWTGALGLRNAPTRLLTRIGLKTFRDGEIAMDEQEATKRMRRRNAGLKAAATKGPEERKREALMAAWTRRHGKNDAANPYSKQNYSPSQ